MLTQTPDFTLVPCERRHLDMLHRIWSDPDIRRELFGGARMARWHVWHYIDESAHWWSKFGFGLLLVLPHGKEGAAGFAGCMPRGNPVEPELLFGLLPEYRGSGAGHVIARAALATVAPERYGSVVAGAHRNNRACHSVLRRLDAKSWADCAFAQPEFNYYRIPTLNADCVAA